MLPYMAYRYVKNKREKNQREMDSDLDSMVRSIVPDKVKFHFFFAREKSIIMQKIE